MATGKDLELALRIKADLDEGRRALQNLGGDVEAVGESSAEASQQLNQVATSAEAAGRGLAGAASAQQQASQAGAALVASLREQIDLFGKSADDIVRYRAAQAGVGDTVEPLIGQLRQLRDAQEAANRATAEEAAVMTAMSQARDARSTAQYAFLEGMREQIALFGKSGTELAEYEAKMLGISDSARPLIEQLRQLQVVQRQAEQAAQAEAEAQRQAGAAKAQAAASQQSFLASLREQVALQGKSGTEILEYRAAQMGVSNEAAAYIAKIRSFSDAQGNANDLLQRGGLTAGQYQQSLRMLPMQLTDVVTSLSSGMPIWMVAIQQGGQIRDSFGGIGNAARAVIGSINPLTAAIAAITAAGVGLVAAYEAGANEQVRFNEALILTGNYAGVTAGQLASVSREMDALAGVTQGSASAALIEVAASGKFAGEQIQLVAIAAEQMRVATGKAVSDTVDEFERLAADPIAAILKLNETQHFLTEAQLEQLRTLREQQGQQAAATEAMRVYAAVIADRTPQVNENLGSIERAWRSIKDVARETIDGLLDIGRPLDDAQRAAELTQRIAYLKSTVGTGFEPLADTQGEIARLSAVLDSLNAKQKTAAESTKSTVDSVAETARQAAADAFVKGAEAQVQSLQKLSNVQRAHLVMQEKGITETSTLGQRMLEAADAADKQKAATDAATEAEREAEKARRKSEQQLEAAARKSEQAAKQQLNYVQGLEKQAATLGLSSSQVRAYELAERGLTGALHARAAAALAVIDAEERKRQADADGKQLVGLQAQLLAAQGQSAAAATLQLEQQYGELLQRLQARGDQAGIDLVNSLINTEQAKAQLSELQAEVDAVFAEQARREQSISTQQQAGLISELGARQQILDLNQQTADQVEKLLPKMHELASVTGDPAAIERVKDLETRLANLRTVANDLTNALKNGLENGIQSALEGLATGTMDLAEAATSFLRSIASAMADMAAQQLAQMATSSIMSMFGGGADSGAGLTAGAAAVSGSAAALSAAGGTLLTGAAAIEVAAASLAAANAGGGGGGGAGGLLASAAGAMGGGGGAGAAAGSAGYTGAFGFADGGHVLGPGTTTSDSIDAKLSNWEFVTRAAVVQQPGALDFLHEFNARGMSALDDWAPRIRHSTGGLAGVPAPALPTPTLGTGHLAEPAKAMGATIKNAQNFYLLDDPGRVADAAFNSRAGEESFVVMLSKDPARYRSILGIN